VKTWATKSEISMETYDEKTYYMYILLDKKMKVSNNNSNRWKVRLYPTSLFISKNVKVVATWLTYNNSQVHFPSGSMPTTTNKTSNTENWRKHDISLENTSS
jgi:hypothetical protein